MTNWARSDPHLNTAFIFHSKYLRASHDEFRDLHPAYESLFIRLGGPTAHFPMALNPAELVAMDRGMRRSAAVRVDATGWIRTSGR